MRTLKLMRLVGALTLLTAAPVIGAIAAYAQTAAPSGTPLGQPSATPKMAPGASAPDDDATTKPEATVPPGKPSAAPSGQSTGDLTTAGPATGPAPLAGQIVMASDGQRVGEVAGVKAAADGRVQEIHIKTGGLLGFGARTVAIPADRFTVSGQNVQLSLSSAEVGKLPAIAPG
jgi:PRC-barrel domain